TGLADDLELWWEYEAATAGRSAIRWSPGLWAKLMPDVDQETDVTVSAAANRAASRLARETWAEVWPEKS
uniref:hypothetical protein n=1 Tax=Nocardia gipuzkoensis TaxID=2749991 RepID=UPI0015EF0877